MSRILESYGIVAIMFAWFWLALKHPRIWRDIRRCLIWPTIMGMFMWWFDGWVMTVPMVILAVMLGWDNPERCAARARRMENQP
jgi:hypothetical protein